MARRPTPAQGNEWAGGALRGSSQQDWDGSSEQDWEQRLQRDMESRQRQMEAQRQAHEQERQRLLRLSPLVTVDEAKGRWCARVDKNCAASQCMKWRWAELAEISTLDGVARPVNERKGYCGEAGFPEIE